MMTLEEAIKNFEHEIDEFEGWKKIHAVTHEDYAYIEKIRQLAEWLKELKAVHNEIDCAYDEDKLKPCPFCNSKVELEKIPLWYGNGRGYKDSYKFEIRCKKCGCRVNQPGNASIYISEEKAKKNAIKAWNRRVKDDKSGCN